MSGDSRFSGLVEAVYDAGLRPELWNDAVVRINEFVGGRACGLFSKDSISKFGVTHYYCGADPHYIALYSETYSRFDPADDPAAFRSCREHSGSGPLR